MDIKSGKKTAKLQEIKIKDAIETIVQKSRDEGPIMDLDSGSENEE